jgi:hypothetical protein
MPELVSPPQKFYQSECVVCHAHFDLLYVFLGKVYCKLHGEEAWRDYWAAQGGR